MNMHHSALRRAIWALSGIGAFASLTSGLARAQPPAPGPRVATAVPIAPANDRDAQRFLQQAAFAYTLVDSERLKAIGYRGWIDEQIAKPVQFSHVAKLNQSNKGYDSRSWEINDEAWFAIIRASDQLRQRWAFALSQLFVNSTMDGSTLYWGRSLAKYEDNFYSYGFGNFRDLLQSVTLNPSMGMFLSHGYNVKENPATGTVPDQNFAREVMQLFTIGLWRLNPDGTRVLDAGGQPIPTYTQDDVVGASRVMTGFAPKGITDPRWWDNHYCFCQRPQDVPTQTSPMTGYNAYHSTLAKSFLGRTIPAGSADANGDLKIFLDTLFNHPNVGPFVGRQMIQRLVTSNPSPAYVGRVAAAFADNGAGVRGDMKAVIRAILLDPEARDPAYAARPEYGRIREPILRMAQIARVFKANSQAYPNTLGIPTWDYDRRKGLWQSPMHSATVFNFYYPTYSPANTELSRQGYVAPEMQISTPVSVADIDWFINDVLQNGGRTDCCSDAERNTFSMRLNYSEWLPLVAQPANLVAKMNASFMAGQMSPSLQADITRAVQEEYRDRSYTSGIVRGVPQMKLAAGLRALVLSPEYVVQK